MMTSVHVFVADMANTDLPWVTKPGYTPLQQTNESYCQDVVDQPYYAIIMRVTLLSYNKQDNPN